MGEGVEFTNTTFDLLWNRDKTLPQTLLSKLDVLYGAVEAYQWWCECTGVFDGSGEYVKPIILLDTAEVLCKQDQTKRHGSKGTPAYLFLELVVKEIPRDHALVAFGTGATTEDRPIDMQSLMNHMPIGSLAALSWESAKALQQQKRSDMNERELWNIYTATLGIPRMLLRALEASAPIQGMRATEWEKEVSTLYEDSAYIVKEWGASCLAKAIMTCAVTDVPLDVSSNIPSEDCTWNDLRWQSILFASSKAVDGGGRCWQIPPLLWRANTKVHKELQEYVHRTCNFALDDLLPTATDLITEADEISAVASGKPWEKLFASALVARFFVLCWQRGKTPRTHYISLGELLPQKLEADNDMLGRAEVCLSDGIFVVSKAGGGKQQTCEKPGRNTGFKWKAIHANWEFSNAHHDMILPVRVSAGKRTEMQLWAISAKSGKRKAEGMMTTTAKNGTKQHLIDKKDVAKGRVPGLIQVVNPREYTMGNRQFKNILREMVAAKTYAEATLTEGQALIPLWFN